METKGKVKSRLTMKPLLNSKFLGFNSKVYHYWETLVHFLHYCISFCLCFCSVSIALTSFSATALSTQRQVLAVINEEVHKLHHCLSFVCYGCLLLSGHDY